MGSGANLFTVGQRVSIKVGDSWRMGKVVRAEFGGDVWVAYDNVQVHVSRWLVPKCVRAIAVVEAS